MNFTRAKPHILLRKSLFMLLVLSFILLVVGRPQDYENEDVEALASEQKDDAGRVQIKVYRGPTKHDGYAPWGFWVKQPSDEE